MKPDKPATGHSRDGKGADRDLKTIVFTDMVGFTRLKQDLGDEEAVRLIRQHHQVVRDLLMQYPSGKEIKIAGDSFFLTFDTPSDAVRFSLRLVSALEKLSHKTACKLQDRIGIHIGEIIKHQEGDQDEDYYGIQVDASARVMSMALANQILLTRSAYENARQTLKGVKIEEIGEALWYDHGAYRLKGVEEPMEIFEVVRKGAAPRIPPDSEKAHRLVEELPSDVSSLVQTSRNKGFLKRLRAPTSVERLQAIKGAALTTGLGILLLLGGVLDRLSFDMAHVVKLGASAEAYTDEVAFVTLDDSALEQLSQPSLREWDRRLHGRLVDVLAASGAKAVVFDVLFQTNRVQQDEAFLAAIGKYRKVAVAAVVERTTEGGFKVVRYLSPFEALATNAWVGLTESAPLSDLNIRRPRYGTSLAHEVGYQSLAEVLTTKLRENPKQSPEGAWLNYYCPPEAIPLCSYGQVISNQFPTAQFSNKVVFVGSNILRRNPDEAGSDRFKTPYSLWGEPHALGVVVNATSYLNLKHANWLKTAPLGIELFFVLVMGTVCGYLFYFIAPSRVVIAGVSLAILVGAISIFCQWWLGVWGPWLVVSAAQIPCAIICSLAVNLRQTSKERRQLIAAITPRTARSATRSTATSVAINAGGATANTGSFSEFTIPDHEMLKVVGKGAYGQVWLAKDVLGSFHAVKVIQQSAYNEGQAYEREFHGLQRFTPISRQHPGLVQILHVGRNDSSGYLYYIMDAADDEQDGQKIVPEKYHPRNLSRDLARRGALPVLEVLELAISLADALGFLHQQGLIHRDIKPANIIFISGKPKLADIGLVTEMVSAAGEITSLGTAGYLAPEGPGTAAGDIYSLGKLLYVISTGLTIQDFPDLPSDYQRRSDADFLVQLIKIINKACDQSVRLRYASARELAQDLTNLRETMPSSRL